MSKSAKRNKALESDSDDDFEKDFKSKKEKRQDKDASGSASKPKKESNSSIKIETRKSTKNIDRDLLLAIELSKREAEAAEARKKGDAEKSSEINVKEDKKVITGGLENPSNQEDLTMKVVSNEVKSMSSGADINVGPSSEENIKPVKKKSESENEKTKINSQKERIECLSSIPNENKISPKKTLTVSDSVSFEVNHNDIKPVEKNDFQNCKKKASPTKPTSKDLSIQNKSTPKPFSSISTNAEIKSEPSKIMKKLPESNAENFKPVKQVERQFKELSGRSSLNSPLGRIELKTPSSSIRLGLSRNSRPKSLHPNAKPSTS